MSKYWNNQSNKPRVPLPVYVLGMGIFVLGTSEFMIAGLLPAIASNLGVSVPRAGLLISAFAVAMVVGAPVLTLLTLRLPRKLTLLAALALFITGNLLAALSSTYGLLIVARVVTALATGAFWAVAAVVTVSLVAETVRARALAILVGGLTVSNVLGVPLGTLIGQQLGWRSAFWAVALLAALVIPVVVAAVPGQRGHREPARLGAEVAAFANGRLWLALATTALFQAGVIGTFSYLAPLLTDVSGLPEASVAVVLAAFGLGNVLGVQIGGRFADAYPWRTLYTGLTAVIVVLGLLVLFARSPVVTVALVFVLGVVAMTLAAPLNARVFALAGPAPTLASATNTSAFNVGNTLGPWLGGVAISAGLGYTAPAWVGVLLVAGALGLGLGSRALDRRTARQPSTATIETGETRQPVAAADCASA